MQIVRGAAARAELVRTADLNALRKGELWQNP